jgi:ubiquinone/menaquinone biosynthesis C-methylase UbiE
MDPRTYDQWYKTSRGKWIGECEADLLAERLQPTPGESLLDVGCGTGFFTRTLATAFDGKVTGVDINHDWVRHAHSLDKRASYVVADARALPYENASFDIVMSITALCFIKNEITAIHEILRVARRRFAIGFLNRHSLLYIQKGRRGGQGGYRGANWQTMQESLELFRNQPVQNLRAYTAIQIPSGGPLARLLETRWMSALPFGAFIVVAGDIAAV